MIRAPFSGVERAAGPFFEPRRPYPIVSLVTAVATADRLELLLARLVRVRRWTLAYPPALGLVLLAFSLPARTPIMSLALFVGGVVAGLVDHLLSWETWVEGGGRSITRPLAQALAPPAPEVIEASRDLHDALIGLRESERDAFLGALAESHPLVATVAQSSWTLVSSRMKQDVG